LEVAEAALESLEETDSFVLRSRLATEVASAAADLIATLHPRRHAERIRATQARAQAGAQLAADLDAGTTVPGTTSVPWTRANAALAAAEAARAAGRDDPARWPPIIDAYRAIGLEPQVAYVTCRAAAAAFAAGDRGSGETLLRESYGLASSIGMVVLLRRIQTLARAARVDLGEGPGSPVAGQALAERLGLSPREREVLALVADGRTNGEIGAALFISTKTASVHVTHILDKLGVSSRTEAALLASREGLLAAPLRHRE
jgi:DNA-binding CsgD family transcriptional regulator